MTTRREVSELSEERLEADTCGWPRCVECAALRSFVAKWNRGRIRPHPPITSRWWQSAAAEALYRRGVHLPRPKERS
jgi:hypothetical protein